MVSHGGLECRFVTKKNSQVESGFESVPSKCYRPLNTRTPFPSSLVPLFQNESKCETILMNQNDFDLHEHETACRLTHFHMKGFALDSF